MLATGTGAWCHAASARESDAPGDLHAGRALVQTTDTTTKGAIQDAWAALSACVAVDGVLVDSTTLGAAPAQRGVADDGGLELARSSGGRGWAFGLGLVSHRRRKRCVSERLDKPASAADPCVRGARFLAHVFSNLERVRAANTNARDSQRAESEGIRCALKRPRFVTRTRDGGAVPAFKVEGGS